MRIFAVLITAAALAFSQAPNQKPIAPPAPQKRALAQRGGPPPKQIPAKKNSGKAKKGKERGKKAHKKKK
jgi:hypothetical protein